MPKFKNKKKTIAIISSCGGHLTEILRFKKVYLNYNYFFVINDFIKLTKDMKGKTFFISHSERDILFFKNLYEAYIIIKKKKPDILISTGAGLIVPFAIISKCFFNIKIIYIETIASCKTPSLTGRLMKYLADDIFFQWRSLKKYFPNGKYIGNIL
jgi:UDP-N-acetylglucosamine:LPS N-acetylglucosamine transferase